jgi:hypothetical protein
LIPKSARRTSRSDLGVLAHANRGLEVGDLPERVEELEQIPQKEEADAAPAPVGTACGAGEAIESKRARAVRAKLCVGLDWKPILDLIEQATKPEHGPILQAIDLQVKDYEDRTPQRPGSPPSRHGFLEWIIGLQDGRWSLPEQLPRHG